MPKEKSIGVSESTLKALKEYQKEFEFNSLDKAISDAIVWARAFVFLNAKPKRDIVKRIHNLENAMVFVLRELKALKPKK